MCGSSRRTAGLIVSSSPGGVKLAAGSISARSVRAGMVMGTEEATDIIDIPIIGSLFQRQKLELWPSPYNLVYGPMICPVGRAIPDSVHNLGCLNC